MSKHTHNYATVSVIGEWRIIRKRRIYDYLITHRCECGHTYYTFAGRRTRKH